MARAPSPSRRGDCSPELTLWRRSPNGERLTVPSGIDSSAPAAFARYLAGLTFYLARLPAARFEARFANHVVALLRARMSFV
jgi:hypothetical protein